MTSNSTAAVDGDNLGPNMLLSESGLTVKK